MQQTSTAIDRQTPFLKIQQKQLKRAAKLPRQNLIGDWLSKRQTINKYTCTRLRLFTVDKSRISA